MYPAERNGQSEGPSPADVISTAHEQAKALMEIVSERRLYQTIKGKDYLVYEAWSIIGAFNAVFPTLKAVEPVTDASGNTTAYRATVMLLQGGVEVGGAESICGLDEAPCKGKTGTAKHRAAMSTAQTWAASKAFRLHFPWVAALAGFEPASEDDAPTVIDVEPQHVPDAPPPAHPSGGDEGQNEQAADYEPAAVPDDYDSLDDINQFGALAKQKGWSENVIRRACPGPKDMTPGQLVQNAVQSKGQTYAEIARRCEKIAGTRRG